MNLFLKSLFAVLLAAFSSSCMVSVNGHPVAGIGFGGPGGHGRGCSPGGHPGGYRPPQGLRCMTGVPPGCREVSRGGHRIVCDPRGRDIGFLRPQGGGYGGGQYSSHGGSYRQGGGYSSGPAFPARREVIQDDRRLGFHPGGYAGKDSAGRDTYHHGYVDGQGNFTRTGAHPR